VGEDQESELLAKGREARVVRPEGRNISAHREGSSAAGGRVAGRSVGVTEARSRSSASPNTASIQFAYSGASAARPDEGSRSEMEPRDAFISYVEEDGDFAHTLVAELRSWGHSTWTYEHDGIPGVSCLSHVYEAITACSVFVLIASPRSVRAHQVIREVEQAHAREKLIVPIRLGITHVEFASADAILQMASGTAVSLGSDAQGAKGTAGKIVATIKFAAERTRRTPHCDREVQAVENVPGTSTESSPRSP
jgi:TIR domain